MTLSFSTLRSANALRLPLFKNSRGEPAHSKPDGSDWSLDDWLTAIVGEVGEAANLIKKVRRGDMPLAAAKTELGKEFADVIIYADLMALQVKFDFTKHNDCIYLSDMMFDEGCGPLSLARTITSAAVSLGFLADGIAGREDALAIALGEENEGFEQVFPSLIADMGKAAELIGLDIEHEVRSKFNAVSLRVGAAVFITEYDTVTMDIERVLR